MKRSEFVLAVALAGLSAGCGAMFGGSRQTVHVDASPPSSVTVVQTGMTQNTPTTISLPRKDNYVLTFEKDGYEPKKVEVQRKMRGGILVLDILFTGLLGVVVDAATGGASDANAVAALGVPTLDGLGPVGGADHSPGEWLDLDSVVPRTALLAGMIATSP